MAETHEHRLKRLRMRSWRRGTKEMDLLLGPFADSELARLEGPALDTYEAVLSENDQDLYQWVSGKATPPSAIAAMLQTVRDFHNID